MLGVGAADDDLSVLVEFECHLGADIDPERLTDRLGQGDLALRGHGGDFVDDRHDRRSLCAVHDSKEYSLPCQGDAEVESVTQDTRCPPM